MKKLDSVKSEYSKSKFINDILGWNHFSDGFMEVVLDFTTSRYFGSDQVDEAVQFATNASKQNHQVYIAPAIRKKDLGDKRSDGSNVSGARCLWVDIDPPDKSLPPDVMRQEAGKLLDSFLENLKRYSLAPSYIISSGNGFHAYFHFQRLYHHGVEEWDGFQRALVELAHGDVQAKDMTRLLRFPGTLNLKNIADPQPVEIIGGSGQQCNPDDFKKLVRDFPQKQVVNALPKDSKPFGFIPPCIESMLIPGNKPPKGYRHLVRQVVATFFFKEGVSQDDAVNKLMHTGDDPKKVETDVKGVFKALEGDSDRYNVGCKDGSLLRSLVDAGVAVCDKDNCQFGKPVEKSKADDKEESKVLSAWFPGLVDLVLDENGEVAYLVVENGNLVLKKEFSTSKGTLVPPPIESIIWLLPKYSEVVKHFSSDSDIQLFEDLVAHFYEISELPTENHYRLNALWAMHTYLFDKSSYSPILWYFAIAGRGKSRTGDGLIYVSWRGVSVITVREAHVIRLATDYRATVFFDCTDLEKRIKKSDSDDVFLCRFEQGKKVARVLYPEKGPFKDTVYYDVYGPTVIATNEPVNSILESRSIQTIMPESDRIFNDDVFAEDGLPFRERLVAFRARHVEQGLPEVEKPIKGRLGDIMRPLLQVLNLFSKDTDWFFEILSDFDKNAKENMFESREARVVRVIYELRSQVRNERLSNETILERLNQDRPDRYHMTAKSLGWITKSLNFKKYADGKQRGIYWDEYLAAMLCGRYGIEYKQDTGPLTI